MTSLQPFEIAVPDAVLDRIAARLAGSRIGYAPDDDDGGWSYGTDAHYLAELVDYWRHAYDWRKAERELNRWPQFKARVDGVDIHFQHVRGSGRGRLPLILTHGWPGSILEFQASIERLAFPERFGGRAEDGFDLVIPSLPGFGWSGRPARPIGARPMATMWRKLMTEVLGYPRFGAQGGDYGSMIAAWLAQDHADVVAAIHLNITPAPLPGPDDDEDSIDYWRRFAVIQATETAYNLQQSTKPQTIGLALHDNPVGAAAWVIEKFHRWGDTHGRIESRFSKDQLITNLMIYLVNDAFIASFWAYRGLSQETPAALTGWIRVPTAIARFPAEIYPMPSRRNAERLYNVVQWTDMPAGGHFAAMEEPVLFTDDVRRFFLRFAP